MNTPDTETTVQSEDRMNEEQYLSRISQLENEIEYLHGLLDNAGI